MSSPVRPVKVSAIVRYNEALEQLRIAAEALDQARAMLKDIGLQHIGTGNGPYRLTVSQIADRAEGLVRSLENEECEECGRLLAGNEVCLEGRCHLTEQESLTEQLRWSIRLAQVAKENN